MRLRNLPKPVWGWAMYDFANSAYATSVMSVIFSVYFASVLIPPEGLQILGLTVPGESLWGYKVAAVMFCVLLLAPALGALADHKSLKRALLIFWSGLGIGATIGLFGARPDHLAYAFTVAFIATLGYEMGFVFYNAFLKDVADEATSGRVSGFGFALGYIGGGLCLGLNMAMIARPELFGLGGDDPTLPIRASMVVVGLWWGVFALPTWLWVRDKPPAGGREDVAVADVLRGYFHQLRLTLKAVWKRRDLGRFLLAFFIYNDGIQTILIMAAIFGAIELGMSTTQLGLCYLMIQFVAFFGAMALGRAADAWSHKKVIFLTLAVYAGVAVWGVFMQHAWEFWILGGVIGLVLGGSQATSRSLYALMIPAARSGEFFSLFSIVGKAASLFGPFLFGVVSQFFGLRAGVGSLIIFFVAGMALLWGVDEKRGRDLARREDADFPLE